MEIFHSLITRPQYTQQDRGSDGFDITELVPIERACRLEETNEQRLALAKFVLGHAIQLIEFEVNMEEHDRHHFDHTQGAPTKGPSSGYN